MVCGILILGCKRVFAVEEVVNAGYVVTGKSMLLLRNAWPKASMILKVFKEQGVVLTLLLGLSALFSMAETAITTLWPWKALRTPLLLKLASMWHNEQPRKKLGRSSQADTVEGNAADFICSFCNLSCCNVFQFILNHVRLMLDVI
ncbi:DUF21 domain-containing protein At1g55930, chloroplastic-like isoform X1 [Gossypium hirsutum]|uniref:DUF21 domain-containing protein At1g55930, chloroplastic-like isoform X1 n=2 Tax=Gossypium TaxID=3633 RepID=A0A1U8IJM4_GOSHI|nr:DUF21 domain-containing protein At1g55930, chloroplastic-like isoform X1 [Gossypium hirsutum]